MSKAATSTRGWVGSVALLTAALIWGFVPTSTRHVVGTLTAEHILLARFLVGAAAAVVLLFVVGAPRPARSLLPRAIALGLLGQMGFNVPLAYGIQHVEAGTTALISGTSPVFMAVLAAPLLGERITPRVTAGLALALSGTAVVASASGGGFGLTGEALLGSLLILLSAVLWAIYSVIVKPWLGRIPPTSIPMVGSIAGLPLMLPLGIAGFGGALGRLEWTGWLALAQFTIAASVVAPILWAVGLQRGQASRAGMYLYLVPLFGVLSGAALLGEPLHLGTLLGGALVVAGLLLATVPSDLLRRPAQSRAT